MTRMLLSAGDRMPDFNLPDVNGRQTGLLTHSRGRPVVLVISAHGEAAPLRAFVENEAAYQHADVFIITNQTPDQNGHLAIKIQSPFALLSDVNRNVVQTLCPDTPLACYLLDQNLRIKWRSSGDNSQELATTLKTQLAQPLNRMETQKLFRPAPILIIPEVFSRDFCQQLIDHFNAGSPVMGGTFDNLSGADRLIAVDTKMRRDLALQPGELNQTVTQLIARRVGPEIKRAFDFTVTGASPFKICCYVGEEEGHFRAHRDNIAPGVAWRRFAVSLLLNNDAEYVGGAMRFAEYSDNQYSADAGDAIVFSCALLHEVLPVTKGKRYVFLGFLFGAEQQKQMQTGT